MLNRKLNTKSKVNEIQDRQLLIGQLSSLNEERNEVLAILVFGSLLIILCLETATRLLISVKGGI